MKEDKSLLLGTALWGWKVQKETCFKLLDQFYEQGFREVDTATNYPINKNTDDFRSAENIIKEWININNICDLKIIVKVGSISNEGLPDNNLTSSFLLMSYDYYLDKFGENLNNIMIHWDNREENDEIGRTVDALEIIQAKGTAIGLSGIKKPERYFRLSVPKALRFTIEAKHNFFQSGLSHYECFQEECRILVYGINAGGLKFNGDYSKDSSVFLRGIKPKDYENVLKELEKIAGSVQVNDFKAITLSQLSLIFAYHNPKVSGIILGPARQEQLTESIESYLKLKERLGYEYFERINHMITRES